MDDSVGSSTELSTPARRPQHLNIPPSISPSTLSVDTHLPWMPREPSLTPSDSTPSSSRTIYTGRFIPSRVSSNFALFDISPLPNGDKEDGSTAYTSLLRSVMFGGDDSSGFSPVTPEKVNCGSPNGNIFRFRTEVRRSLFTDARGQRGPRHRTKPAQVAEEGAPITVYGLGCTCFAGRFLFESGGLVLPQCVGGRSG